MSVIKGLFFDLDGTLVDSLEADFRAYQKALELEGREFSQKMYDSIVGMRADKFLKELYPDISGTELKKVWETKGKIYPEFLHLVRPNRQLIDFFMTLRSSHVTVLVTTARKINAEAVLKVAELDNMFDHIITGDMVTHAKPNPEVYLKALELSGLEAGEVVAFEDSEPGSKAATSAGIKVIKITIEKNNED